MRTHSTIIIICLLSLFLIGTGSAQWVQTPLDSVQVSCFAINSMNLFAATMDSGVFLSTNNGTSWIAVNNGLTNPYVQSLAVGDTNLFTGIYGGGVFLSTNNGTSWTATGLTVLEWCGLSAIAIFGTNVFVGISGNEMCGAGRVYRSTNYGVDWTEVLDLGRLTGVHTLAVLGTQLFVGTWDHGLLATSDTGMTWTTKNVGLEDSSVHALAMNGSNYFAGTYSGVFLSINNGNTWTAVNSGLTDSAVACFAVSGSNVFAGTAHGVFLTTNNGSNWRDVSSGLTDSSITTLTVSDSFLFAGTASAVWRRPLLEMITSVYPSSVGIPDIFNLGQNYPNPFNPSTRIGYQLPTQSHVTLKVFDVLGREVATLVNGVEEPGYKSVTFDANKLSSGVYYYRLQARDYIETKKLLLLR